MAKIPTTSTTLLRDLARDSQHARWGEFVARYRPMMESYLRERFPAVDADEAVQETLIALIRALPVYRYVPEETGHFRSYLTGILRHKALRAAARADRWARRQRAFAGAQTAAAMSRVPPVDADEEARWRQSLLEIALQQLLADASVHARTREVFRRVAVNGEKPDDVAQAFGIARNAVDQMKSRMMERLRTLVRALEAADGVGRR